MATKPKPELKKPEKFDLAKGRSIALKVIKENKEWLKEMADK